MTTQTNSQHCEFTFEQWFLQLAEDKRPFYKQLTGGLILVYCSDLPRDEKWHLFHLADYAISSVGSADTAILRRRTAAEATGGYLLAEDALSGVSIKVFHYESNVSNVVNCYSRNLNLWAVKMEDGKLIENRKIAHIDCNGSRWFSDNV